LLLAAQEEQGNETRLKSGVVATIGETMTTLAVVSATSVSNAPNASQNPEIKKYITPLLFHTSPWPEPVQRM